MEILYIIGNGFDLNIGLKTSYTDFYNYYNSLVSTKEKVNFLKESIAKDYQTWADLELGLGEYTSKLADVEECDEIFEDITEQLALYLEKEENQFDFGQIDLNKFYSDLCFPQKYLPFADSNILTEYNNKWYHQHWNVRIITLNYTRSLEKIFKVEKPNFQIGTQPGQYQINIRSIEHLHGYIDDRMIMGVNDISQIKNESFHNAQEILEAIVKPMCNVASKAGVDNICKTQINSADLICIFGSSIGDTDKTWWELIGKQLKRGIKLVIFTRGNEISKRRPYKKLRHDREIKKYFLDKTDLSDIEKNQFGENIFIAFNTEMFSHMRSPL
jgi:hypothetical protein